MIQEREVRRFIFSFNRRFWFAGLASPSEVVGRRNALAETRRLSALSIGETKRSRAFEVLPRSGLPLRGTPGKSVL
ncbi:unnamed protein product [Ectocarpus sp. 12 AP-2014]